MHILIISDSCYSGALMRDVEPTIRPEENSAYIAKMMASKSRNLMSSGGVEPVADGGGGAGHSIFANALLESLGMMEEKQFTAADLFQKFIKRGVAGRSKQVPQYSFIRDSGDEFGDFIFYRPKDSKAPSGGQKSSVTGGSALDKVFDQANGPSVLNVSANASNRADSSSGGSDRAAIDGLTRRYQNAYNQIDAAALWQIWPEVSKRTKQTLDDAFKRASAIKMSLTLDPPKIEPDGTATVKGQMSQEFTFKEGSPRPPRTDDIVFKLKKTNGVWVIIDVK
jgi:hypothetical protein